MAVPSPRCRKPRPSNSASSATTTNSAPIHASRNCRTGARRRRFRAGDGPPTPCRWSSWRPGAPSASAPPACRDPFHPATCRHCRHCRLCRFCRLVGEVLRLRRLGGGLWPRSTSPSAAFPSGVAASAAASSAADWNRSSGQLGHRLVDQSLERDRIARLRGGRAQLGRRRLALHQDHLADVLGLERLAPGEHLEQHHADRVEVGARIDRPRPRPTAPATCSSAFRPPSPPSSPARREASPARSRGCAGAPSAPPPRSESGSPA